MSLDLIGAVFVLPQPKLDGKRRMAEWNQYPDLTSHHGHGFEYMDRLTSLVALIDHIGQWLAR